MQHAHQRRTSPHDLLEIIVPRHLIVAIDMLPLEQILLRDFCERVLQRGFGLLAVLNSLLYRRLDLSML